MPDNHSDATVVGWTKDFLGAIREGMIILAIALVLLWPSRVRAILAQAGIREIAGVSFDWEGLAEASENALDSRQQVTEIATQLEQVQANLQSLAGANPDHAEVQEIARQVQDLESKARNIDTALQDSLAAQADLLQKAPSVAEASKQTLQRIKEFERNQARGKQRVPNGRDRELRGGAGVMVRE